MMPCTSYLHAVQPQDDGMVLRQGDPAAPTGHQVIRSTSHRFRVVTNPTMVLAISISAEHPGSVKYFGETGTLPEGFLLDLDLGRVTTVYPWT
jgi:hypothetical protein